VDRGRFDDDMAILDQLFDVLTRVGVGDFSLLGGIEPDFTFAGTRDGGCQPFLRSKVNHLKIRKYELVLLRKISGFLREEGEGEIYLEDWIC
jgi:hypothetical protein